MTTKPDEERIKSVFFPYAYERAREVQAARRRFVYYTTAKTAVSILTHKQLWMRNITAMNDYMEGQHGFECLDPAYRGEPGKRLRDVLDGYFPGLSRQLLDHFNGYLAAIQRETYMTCVSEHFDDEDQHGRLSMWRAYGGDAGVALVLNGDVMFSNGDVLAAYASPVAYWDADEFARQLTSVVERIERESDYVRSLGHQKVKDIAFNMLRFAVLCTKHPGFHEEREWRIVASPVMYPSPLTLTVEVVHATAQPVLKIDLRNYPNQGLEGLALPDLLNRVIIGPCEFPQVMLAAFRELLRKAEVAEPESKVVVSGIPLRHP
jgi:hypothetical protein